MTTPESQRQLKVIRCHQELNEAKEAAQPFLQEYVFSDPRHRWYKEGMSKEELQKLEKYYKERYGGKEVK